MVALVVDLDGKLINDIYCQDPKYKVEELHICVFPLENSTIVMMFIDSTDKRYRSFYKKFNTLSLKEQLSIINYIIFLYSEEMFLSKDLSNEVLQNQNLLYASKQTGLAVSKNYNMDAIKEAKKIYDLSRASEVPCLLDQKYKIR